MESSIQSSMSGVSAGRGEWKLQDKISPQLQQLAENFKVQPVRLAEIRTYRWGIDEADWTVRGWRTIID